jgi:hypothetical protein
MYIIGSSKGRDFLRGGQFLQHSQKKEIPINQAVDFLRF